MQRPHERRNLIRELIRLGRRTTEVIHLDYGEIGDGELVDREVVSSVQETGIDIKEISYKRLLPCSHVSKASDIASVCDICGRVACDRCTAICQKCQKCLCRYCTRIFVDENGEGTYCTLCYMDVKARRTAINISSAVFRFFVEK